MNVIVRGRNSEFREWEDDRTILQTCQQMGAKSETFQHIADSLKNKTAAEVSALRRHITAVIMV